MHGKKIKWMAALVVGAAAAAVGGGGGTGRVGGISSLEIYFSPDGGCTSAIIQQINNSQRTIQLQAYSFTSKKIASALVAAHRRGIKVSVILDKSQRTDRYSSATFLNNQGIKTHIDDNHAIAHNKVIIIDGRTVITGSFNFSSAAEERNAENLLIITDPHVAWIYGTNWQHHLTHSDSFTPVR